MKSGEIALAALIIIAVCALLAAGIALIRERRSMDRLEKMLDGAIKGEFQTKYFDETRLSRLEEKLFQFLSASSLSRKKLDADSARIRELIGDISHQTRTPLANILLYAELLGEQGLTEEASQMAGQIAAQSEKLTFLIQSLVKVSRLESGVVQVSPRQGDLRPLLENAAEAYQGRANEKGIALAVHCEGPLKARFDPKWTAEALENILDNAVKYTPRGGKVTLSGQSFELFCRVDITDTGMGIPEEEQPKVFGRFYRSPAVREAQGVGIGLYLARQIISAQGGYIRVRSKEGEGASFFVYLPIEAEKQELLP